MNKQIIVRGLAVLLAVTAGAGLAGCNEGEAKVQTGSVKAGPVAREECHDETVTLTKQAKDKNQIAGTAVGAIIGGVLGNQIGKGDGKKLATAGGAVAGGYAGNKIQENAQEKNTYTETKRVCKTVYDNG
ncbi:MAG: glycine zipper 2TM domain-containing protein [Steroidobacteraceae bacterium]